MRWGRHRVNIKTVHQSLTPKNFMAQKTLTTSYLSKLANANHDGVTQQIDDRLQAFETENTMLPHPTDK